MGEILNKLNIFKKRRSVYKIQLNDTELVELDMEEVIGCANIKCEESDIDCINCNIRKRKLFGQIFHIDHVSDLITR